MAKIKDSSVIDEVDHDGHGLVVTFRSGRVYRYPTAGAEHVEGFQKAESAGRYFNTVIRANHDHEANYAR
jgi:hypothetical protein